MNAPGGQSQQDPRNGQQVDPLTGQPLHNGQQPSTHYGGLGYPAGAQHPPPAGHPPGRNRKRTAGLVAVLVGAVALLSAGGVGLHYWLTGVAEPTAVPVANPPQSTSPTTTAAASETQRQEPSSTTQPSAPPNVSPSIPAWQPVVDPRTSVAYDVPPEWKVESPGVLVGFENENGPRVAMHTVGTYKDEACPRVDGSYRGRTGIMGDPVDDVEPRVAAEGGARMWATAVAEVPEDDPSVPRPRATEISVGDGLRAWKATTTITPPDGQCAAPKVQVTAVSFTPRDGGGSVLFVMYTDKGVPDALPGDVARKIISTLRPVG